MIGNASVWEEQWGFGFMDELPCPEPGSHPLALQRSAAPQPQARGPGHPMSRAEAEASLARYNAKHPGQTHIRKAYAGLGDDTTLSRFVKIGKVERKPKARNRHLPGFGHPAVEAGRSLFHRNGVKEPDELGNMLVSGHVNVKIGRDVRKGRLFRGYWIYTLTLEERATCPRTCSHWTSCYGNNMPWARRVRQGPRMLRKIEVELAKLLKQRGRAGILVRLHALGDFYSPEYVAFWDAMLRVHPRLAIYGYTARRRGDPIGDAIAIVKARHGQRFAVRWSDGGEPDDCTVSIMDAADVPAGAFVCPEQTYRTAACATCGLCWNTTKNVAFVEH